MGPPACWSWLAGGICWLCLAPTHAAEFDARVKWFSSGSALPSHDVQRQLDGTPAYDYTGDLRMMFRHDSGPWTWIADATTTLNGGDSFNALSAPGSTLDQSATDDDFRLVNLSWEIEDGSRHRSVMRMDRLAAKYSGSTWAVTVGRQAVSWGNGIVFQPLDLFNPFAPTTIDRDYKAGDDLLLVDKLFANGSDLQLLGVARRNQDEDYTGQASSLALKWHGFLGNTEVELVAGKHYADDVYAVSAAVPLGGALVRSDVVATNLRHGGWEYSGVVNIDYSFFLLRKNVYVFAEYYHNGFGVDDLPFSAALLPEELLDRVQRGETFTLMKDYLAAGTNIEWHALWSQGLTLITNLHDSSSILQVQLNYEPGDHSRLQFGVSAPLGRAGDEYGGVPVLGEDFTSGGGRQGFLRYVYYF